MPCFDDETEVWRKSTGIASTSCFFVGIRTWHIVGKLSRTLEHFALVIRTIFVLYFLGHGFHFVHGVRHAYEIAPCYAIERVACGTNFAVYLVSSTNAVRCNVDQLGKLVLRIIFLYLAWSKVLRRALWSNGQFAGCRPSSAGELACTSLMKGKEPYRWVYQAMDPAVKIVTDASAFFEDKKP